jgi:hypothetical protein
LQEATVRLLLREQRYVAGSGRLAAYRVEKPPKSKLRTASARPTV